MIPFFRLYSLPLELIREIVHIASAPSPSGYTTGPQYSNAVALARVSYAMRQFAMPHLLHTVILKSHENVAAFFRALQMQHEFTKKHDRLSFSYPRSVRRFWCSQFYEPLMQSTEYYDYHFLFDVLSHAQQIGFHVDGIQLLHQVLGDGNYRDSIPSHFCKNLTIAGSGIMRWNPLTATLPGAKFLDHLTHLTILRPDNNVTDSSDHSDAEYIHHLLPHSATAIPFAHMRNLTHFAICLNTNLKEADTVSVLVVNSGRGIRGGEDIKRRLFGGDTQRNPRIVNISTPKGCGNDPSIVTCIGWELAFYEQGQEIWSDAPL